jgi:hypothetical protein
VQPQHLGGLLAIALPSRRAKDAELLGLGPAEIAGLHETGVV